MTTFHPSLTDFSAMMKEVSTVTVETIKITIDEKFPAEKAIRKFKRYVESYGVVREYRKRQEYKKPSVCKKEKLEAAEKRRRKSQHKGGRRMYKI